MDNGSTETRRIIREFITNLATFRDKITIGLRDGYLAFDIGLWSQGVFMFDDGRDVRGQRLPGEVEEQQDVYEETDHDEWDNDTGDE
jgi:hypothetical protein